MKKRIVALSVPAVAIALVLAGCGSSSSKTSNKVLNTTAQANVETVDPNRVTDVGSDLAVTQTVEGLYKQNNKGKIVASVAQKIVKPTDNGKVYTFNLKKTKWSDGSAVTAQDFVASFRRQVEPKTKSQRANHLEDLVNYSGVASGKLNPDKLGVKALGKYKLQITLSHKVPYYNYVLATQLFPVNRKDLSKWGTKYGTSSKYAASNGAYVIKNWNSSKDTWNLVKNKDYYGAGHVKINKIHFQVVKTPQTGLRLFQSKEVQETQLSGSYVSMVKKQYKKDLVVSKYGEQAFLTWNNYNSTAKNTNLRRAISYSLNRKTLASDVLKDGSQAAKSIVPSGEVKGSNGKDFNTQVGNGLAYNSTKAKYYFKLAQQELGKKKITIQLLTADTDAYKSVGEYIQAQAQKVLPGLKITIKSIPLEQEITAFSDHNYQFGTLGWSTDFPDPIDYLNIAAKGGEINFTNWTNAKYQKVIDQINDTKNQTASQRVKLQQKAAKILNTEQGVTPLYQYASVHLVSSDLKGLSYPLIGYQKYEYVSWK